MIIITKSNEGHYGYYLSIIQNSFKNSIVIDLNDKKLSLFKIILNARKEKFIALNGDYLIRKKPFIFFVILLLKIELVQIFYNIDFIYKKNARSYIFKFIFIIQKLFFKNIKNVTLVDHLINEKLGLVHIPDPIDTKVSISADTLLDPFILLFGTHGPRKGTYNFLKKYEGELEVVVVGKIVDERIHEFKKTKGFKIIEGFVNNETKNNYFRRATCVAIPYINWFGSSGVLGHAILFNKIIIGPRKHHIGRVLKEYSKAYFIETEKDKIKIDNNKIEKLINTVSNSDITLQKYYSEEKFVEIINQ